MKISVLIFATALLGVKGGGLLPMAATDLPDYTFESALRERFDDPSSVAFRKVTKATDGRSHCGEVNGRNRHGGSTGFRRFLVFGGHGAFMVLIAEGDRESDGLTCG